jgi:hypothetical protein
MRLSIDEVNVYRYVDENVKCIKNKPAETSIGRHVKKTHTPQCMLNIDDVVYIKIGDFKK